MKKLALVAAVAACAALPACTTFHSQRRTLTDWSLSQIREKRDPCGSMSADTQAAAGKIPCNAGNADGAARSFIDAAFVKPVAFALLPVSWLGDTLILNPINAYKKAELDSHERRYCAPEAAGDNWSDAHAAHHAYGAVPVLTPWVVSDALAAPEFAARWIWSSVYPTDPVNQAAYEQYWREHNETTGE